MSLKNSGIPQLDLSLTIQHKVPQEIDMELYIEFKKKGLPRDLINPVDVIVTNDGELLVKNRRAEYVYRYPIKDIRAAYFIPMEVK